jgi:hypothetical protein
VKLSYVRSPWSEVEYVCWCGALHGKEEAAAGCDHERRRVPVVPEAPPCQACGAPRSGGRRTCGRDCVRGVDPRSARPEVESHQPIPDSRAPKLLLVLGVAWILLVMVMLMMAGNDDPGAATPAPNTTVPIMARPTGAP